MKDKNKHSNYKCHCCGYFTLSEAGDNSFEICPVCCWEDDGVQSGSSAYEGGANTVNLITARKNFLEFGASEECFKEIVRKPNEEEK